MFVSYSCTLLAILFILGIISGDGQYTSGGTTTSSVSVVPGAHDKPFYGFGANVWSTDTVGQKVACDYGFKLFRSSVGPNWEKVAAGCTATSHKKNCPPIGQPQAAYDTYVANNFDADCHAGVKCRTQGLVNIAAVKAKGLKWVATNFQLPSPIVTISGASRTLNTKYTKDLVFFYGAIAHYVKTKQAGLSAEYFELNNEPDGTYDAKISPAAYNSLIKSVYTTFVTRGISSKIIGPGTSQIAASVSEPYVDALDSGAIKAIGGFSSHAWDSDSTVVASLDAYMAKTTKKSANKPVFITEYGAKDNKNRASPDFANSVASLTFQLLSRKPAALVQWEAADQPSEGAKQWGLVASNGTAYPSGNLFKNFLPYFKFDANTAACYLDITYTGISGLMGAAVRGTLDGKDSVVIPYWNTAKTLASFKQTVTISGVSFNVVKSIHLDGFVSTEPQGYQGMDVASIASNSGALYLFQVAPPSSRKFKSYKF